MRTGNEVMSERARRAQRQPPVGVNMDKFAPDRQVSGRSLTGTSHGAWRPEHDLWPLSRAAMLHWGRSRAGAELRTQGRASVLPGRVRGPHAGVAASARLLRDGAWIFRSHTAHSPSSASGGGVCVGGGGSTGLPALSSREFSLPPPYG